jgi:hypothetical protein
MRTLSNLWNLVLAAALILSSGYQVVAAPVIARSAVQEQTKKVLSEKVVLTPINAFGDTTQYVVSISEDLLCGVSQSRLKIFSKDNVENVISSYWTPHRLPRVFEYYKGYIYLVQPYGGIQIFDVREPEKITLVNKIEIRVAMFAEIEIRKDKLFMADERTKELVVLSLADPEHPQELSRYPLDKSMFDNSISCIEVIDDSVYVLGAKGMTVLDVHDLKSPKLLGAVGIDTEKRLKCLVVKDSYAYTYAADELIVLDMSNPKEIEQKSAIRADWCYHAILRGSYFMGFGGNGVFIYDLSNPLRPKRVRKYYNNIPDNFLVGKDQDYIIDDTGKANLVTGLPSFAGAQGRFAFKAENIVVQGKLAYVFGQGQLRIIDINQPLMPEQIACVRASCGYRATILIDSNYLYTPYQILDISNPGKPVKMATIKGGTGTAIKDDYLLFAKDKSLEIWNIKEPAKAMKIKNISLDEQLNKVFVHKGILYLGFYRGKLRSCRLDDNLRLKKLDEINLAKGTNAIIMDFCQEDEFLYVALNEDGICSVDIQDPNKLKLCARFNTSQFSEHVEVVDGYAYVADGSGGTIIIDMAKKGYEKKIASYPTTDLTRAIAVSDDYIYSCDSDSGIMVFHSNLPEPNMEQAEAYVEAKSETEQAKEKKGKKEYQPRLQSESVLKQYAEKLIAEGALLEPINAIGDNCQYVCAINDDLMCGVSRLRLKIFQKDNIENVLSSYWTKARFPRIFEYYRGYIYLPQPYKGIWIFDAREPTELRLVRKLTIPFGYHTNIVARDDKLMYIDPEEGALVVLSLANPIEPLEISRCDLGQNMRDNYKANIQIVGDRIYVLSQRCLALIDTQDLYLPKLLGAVDLDSSSGGAALAVSGPYAYVYEIQSPPHKQIHIFDVSNPEAIEHKKPVKVAMPGEWERCAVVSDTHIITFGEGVYIYDITEPLKPELVRHHYNNIPGNFLIGKSRNYTVDDHAKAEPLTGLPYFSRTQSKFAFKTDSIIIRDKFAYVFGDRQLRVFDISSPWSPGFITTLNGCTTGLRAAILMDDNYLCTPGEIIDISEPARPRIIKKLVRTGQDVAQNGKHLIIAKEDDLHIWDIQSPTEANSVDKIPLGARATKLLFHKGIFYIGFHKPKLWSCVLEDDLTLTVLDEIELAKKGPLMGMCVENDFLYAALHNDGVASVDIKNPSNLKQYAHFDTKDAIDIEAINAYVYVARGRNGTIIVDLAEEGKGREIASYPPAHWTRAIAVSGNYVYSGDEEYGITVFVSNLSSER